MIEVEEQQSLSKENFSKLQEIKAFSKKVLITLFIDHWISRTLELFPDEQIPHFQQDQPKLTFLLKRFIK